MGQIKQAELSKHNVVEYSLFRARAIVHLSIKVEIKFFMRLWDIVS